jgi:carbohydrate kinase (thermoresistant glucokinase family)
MSNKVIYIMGVSGSGKTLIGEALSAKTGFAFYDADNFHPQDNIDKMKAGIPLTDEDRWPWLDSIYNFVAQKIKTDSIIMACSALKQIYRDKISEGIETQCRWVFLNGSYETILQRLHNRTGHYMLGSLLQSQFDALEIPADAIDVDINLSPGAIVEFISSSM